MGVGADNHLTGSGQPPFGHQRVLHAHLSHVKEIGNFMLVGKLPGLLAQLGGLDVLAGGVVVQNDGDFILVKDLGEARLLKFGDGHRGGDVVAQHQIQSGLDELTSLHLV